MAFASPIGLQILALASIWHADGTFRSAAQFFMQLYIIHGVYEGHTFPCVFAFMKRRREKDYSRVIAAVLQVTY